MAAAEAAGLTVVDLREAALRAEFFDVGAVVYFLRKVIWTVPGFAVDAYRDRLRDVHDRIQAERSFVAWSRRFLIEAVKPRGEAVEARREAVEARGDAVKPRGEAPR